MKSKVFIIAITLILVLFTGANIALNMKRKMDVSKIEGLEVVNIEGNQDSKSEEANYILMLSNQSFRKPNMKMTVYIDGIEVFEENCKVEDQHKGYYYYFNLIGEHEIRVVSGDGKEAVRNINFEKKSIWSSVLYWNGEEEGPQINHELSDEPFLWD